MSLFDDSDLEQNLEKYLKKNVEIETMIRGNFSNMESFIDLFDKEDYTVKQEHSVDYYTGNDRIKEKNGKYYLTSKKDLPGFPKIFNYQNSSIKLRVSEEKSEISTKPKNYFMTREKTRTSLIKDNISIDITHVKENKEKKWEIEVEVIDPLKFVYKDFIETTKFIFDSLVNIDYNIKSFFNNTFGKNRGDMIDYGKISKARDLHYQDLTNDGLLNDYSISPKADGKLFFLIFHSSGIFLVSSLEINRLSLLNEKYKKYENTIYAGELLDKEKIKQNHELKANQLFLIFDTLIYNNNIVHNKNYRERQKFFQEIDIILNKEFLLEIKKKIIIDLGTNSEDFCKNNAKAFELEKSAYYETDGLIYTPNKSGYIAEGQQVKNLKQEDRKLGNYTDVCKYKLPENLTIDFLVQNGKLFSKSSGRNLPFKGNVKFPFDSSNYEVDSTYNNKIVEFSPNIDGNRIVYRPIRIRKDKNFPNKIEQALDLWKLVHDPIRKETLICKDVKLMRKFNNQIKSSIIKDITGYVVDIGAGKGGDIPKFLKNKNIKKIIAVEPNKTFVEEYRRRLEDLQTFSKFTLLNSGGEEYEKILEFSEKNFPKNMKDEDFNITFMISLSFFWSSKTFLDKLATAINKLIKLYKERGGNKQINIYYFSIIGSKVKQLFKNLGNKINLDTITLEKISSKSYFVDIEDSVTVYDQTEYFVNLSELWELTGFEISKQEELIPDLPKDYILSKNQKIYNSLFEYGKVVYTGDPADKVKCIRLEVNIDIGIPFENGLAAKNDDEIEVTAIDKNLFRIATIDDKNSLYHSIIKLLSSKYRKTGLKERIKMVEKFKKQINNSKNLDYISKKIAHNIVLFSGKNKKIYGNENKNILLNLCQDNTYEPIAYKVGDEFSFVVDNYSFLLK